MSSRELDPPASGGTPGSVLAQARHAAGITQREVSDALHLPISTIEAIEVDDKSRLPAHVFTRGYVRAYAKLLDLEPDRLVAALSVDSPADDQGEELQTSKVRSNVPAALATFDLRSLKQPRFIVAGVGAAVIVILAVMLIWGTSNVDEDLPGLEPVALATEQTATQELVQQAQPSPQQPSPQQQQRQQAQPAPQQQPPGVSEQQVDATPERQTATRAPEGDESISQSIADSGADSAPAQIQQDTGSAAPLVAGLKRLTPAGEDRLSMEFTDECWVEIKDANGEQVFGDLGRAGQRLEFVGAGPFRILLGYAPGVLLAYNAEPVALAPHTRNNVASLVLGQ